MWIIKSRRIRRGRHVACMGQKTNSYRNLMGKPEENRPLRSTSRRRKENTKLNLKKEKVRTLRTGFTWLRMGRSDRL
jgi:hypothetical protein